VEFALFAPLLLLILLIGIDFGRLAFGWITLTNMTRIGANYAALNPTAWQSPDTVGKQALRARYQTLMAADYRNAGCTVPTPIPDPVFPASAPNTYSFGSAVQVDITCSFRLITPLIGTIVGDGLGNLPVSASSTFTIRTGSVPTVVAPPSPTTTPPPTPTPDPNATPPTVSFYGTPTSADSNGGGPPGSPNENQIYGIPGLTVTFANTTAGPMSTCLWQFGDGTSVASCAATVSKTYPTRGMYNVTLTVDGGSLTRTSPNGGYVSVGCMVPDFHQIRKNSAAGIWSSPSVGFVASNLSTLPGNGNYLINTQSLASGLLVLASQCSTATITVGP
jgi:Flp pilus assembly protein TadG